MPSQRSKKPGILRALAESFLTWRRYRQGLLAPYGITLQQAFVLRRIQRDGTLHPSQIAELLYCDRPTASVVIRNMARQGWVDREPDPRNRKYANVGLTSEGQAKLDELASLGPRHDGVADPLAAFTRDELDEFLRLLKKLRAGLASLPEDRSRAEPKGDDE